MAHWGGGGEESAMIVALLPASLEMYRGRGYPYKSCLCTFWPCHPNFNLHFHYFLILACISASSLRIIDLLIGGLPDCIFLTDSGKTHIKPRKLCLTITSKIL